MRLVLLVVGVCVVFLSSAIVASDRALSFSCDFMEKLGDQPWQVVDRREFKAPLNTFFNFSMGNFGYRLNASALHDTIVQIESQVNCFGSPSRNFFRQDVVFQGAAIFFDSALVRDRSVFRIRLIYDSLVNYTSSCQYNFADSSYQFDPSGDFDFHFVRNSLGDYHWNSIRDAFEHDYDGFVERFHLTDRTKTNFYISPCPPPDIGWDSRWNNGYDYSRHNVFAYYDHGINELHPQVVYMLRLMRLYGYTPVFLQEGAAMSLEYCEIWAKDAYKNGKLPDVTKLGESRTYRAIDRDLSAYTAGSFVNFVYNTGGWGRFLQWYQQATDLTMVESFQSVYNQPMSEVVGKWHAYLDTVTFTPAALTFFGARAQSFLRYPDMMIYAEKALADTGSALWASQTLSGLYYTFGDFKKAAETIEPLLKDTVNARQMQVFYANMLFAAGELDSAKALYENYKTADTSLHLVYYKLGLIEQDRRNYDKAIELFRKAVATTRSPAAMVDYDLALGDAFLAQRKPDSAGVHFQSALDNSKLLVGASSENALNHLRMGKAALRLNSQQIATDELDLALFLEERMFYIGQILVAKGELADLQKKRKAAIAEYKQVLALPTAFMDRQRAQKHLDRPYPN